MSLDRCVEYQEQHADLCFFDVAGTGKRMRTTLTLPRAPGNLHLHVPSHYTTRIPTSSRYKPYEILELDREFERRSDTDEGYDVPKSKSHQLAGSSGCSKSGSEYGNAG